MLASLQEFPALAVDAFLGEKLPPELSRVCVSSAALDQAAKHLSLVLQFREVFCGIEGWRYPVGYCESPFAGRLLPVMDPCRLGGGFGPLEGERP